MAQKLKVRPCVCLYVFDDNAHPRLFSLGQLIMHCTELLKIDKTRSFLFGVLINATLLRIFKVERGMVKFKFKSSIKGSKLIKWYDPDDDLCGFHVLARMTTMTPPELGMRSFARVPCDAMPWQWPYS